MSETHTFKPGDWVIRITEVEPSQYNPSTEQRRWEVYRIRELRQDGSGDLWLDGCQLSWNAQNFELATLTPERFDEIHRNVAEDRSDVLTRMEVDTLCRAYLQLRSIRTILATL